MNCTLVKNLYVIHHSWWNNLKVFELHEYRPNYWFEASAVKALRPICTLSRSQDWKYNIPIRCSRFFTVTSVMVSKWTYFKMRISKECFLYVCHPGIVLLILSSRRILSFSVIRLCSRMYPTWDCCCRRCCCFLRRPVFTRIVKATVSRCTLEDSSMFQRCSNFVSLTCVIPR